MNKKILFVDDEQTVLKGIQRLLHPMRNEWEMKFAVSGDEALQILKQEPFDVVVSDMRMPVMDGLELLSRIKEEYPNIVRIILSGHSDNAMILKSTGVTHQYLSKPCDVSVLKSTIGHACSLRDTLQTDNLKKLITQMSSIPSMPTLYKKVIDELNSPDASINKIGSIISNDVGMTAKILQLVNSAFFGLRRDIYSTQEAVTLLGIDTVKSLVLSVGIFSQYENNSIDGFSIKSLMDHSMQCGAFAKSIAKSEKADKLIIANTFMAGLLHDIGKLLVAVNFPEKFNNIIGKVKNESLSFWEAEKIILGVSHSEVGAYLLGLWGLPDPIVEALAFHHHPSESSNNQFSPLTAVHAADVFSHKLENTSSGNEINIDYLKEIKMNERIETWEQKCLKEK